MIFCRNYDDCSNLYANLVEYMGEDKTEPSGYPNLLKHRMFTMYTRVSTVSMKEKVMTAFCSDSNLHVVIATNAFSMGIECRPLNSHGLTVRHTVLGLFSRSHGQVLLSHCQS